MLFRMTTPLERARELTPRYEPGDRIRIDCPLDGFSDCPLDARSAVRATGKIVGSKIVGEFEVFYVEWDAQPI